VVSGATTDEMRRCLAVELQAMKMVSLETNTNTSLDRDFTLPSPYFAVWCSAHYIDT